MKKIFIIAVLCFFCTGCANYKIMRDVTPFMMLDNSQYQIIGDIEGEAIQTEYVFGVLNSRISASSYTDIMSSEYSDDRSSRSRYSFSFDASLLPRAYIQYPIVTGNPEQMAIYDAIMKNKEADFMIFPKFQYQVSGLPPLYKKVKVKVIGKGVKVKTTSVSD